MNSVTNLTKILFRERSTLIRNIGAYLCALSIQCDKVFVFVWFL